MVKIVRTYWNECVAFRAVIDEAMPQWLIVVIGLISIALCFFIARFEFVDSKDADDEFGIRNFLPSGNPFLFFGTSFFYMAQWFADYVNWGSVGFLIKCLAWLGAFIQAMYIFSLALFILMELIKMLSNIRHLYNIFISVIVLCLNFMGLFLCMNIIGPIAIILFFVLGLMMPSSSGKKSSGAGCESSDIITDQYGNVHYVSKHMGNDSVLTKDGETYHRMPDGKYRKF